MHPIALTITTDEIKSWGLVGGIIIVLAAVITIRLVRSLVGRLVWTIVALALLAAMWAQRTQIENSVRACDPHVLGVHLQISDPAQRASCASVLTSRK